MISLERVKRNIYWQLPFAKHLIEAVKVKMGIMKISDTKYWKECEKFYDSTTPFNSIIIDVGDDVGISPLYFLSRGAKKVYGFGTMPQLYYDKQYVHTHYEITENNIHYFINELKHILLTSKAKNERVMLKMDIEGAEWLFNLEFITSFDEYVIALHSPIKKQMLYCGLKETATFVGSVDNIEFAIYRGIRK